MSTDFVSVTKPSVINSHQDINNRPNITPAFVEMMHDHQEFEDAYEDNDKSIQAMFWVKYKDSAELLYSLCYYSCYATCFDHFTAY